MNLYEQLNELYKDPNSYYYDFVFRSNPFKSPNKSYQFIEEYFTKGAKEKVFDKKYINELKKNGKNFHTVSIYFFGIMLKALFDNRIEKDLNKLDMNYSKSLIYKFAYTWFLTSLYHDTAWIIEENSSNSFSEDCSALFVVNSIKKKFEIVHDLYQHNWIYIRPIKYSQELMQNYLHYSVVSRKRIDHGIIGGLVIFDRLKKNYVDNWNEYCNEYGIDISTNRQNNRHSSDDFNFKGVSWKKEHIDHYGYVANAIISHNVWTSKNKALYRRYSLDELIHGKFIKISKDENPLIYLLALVDTIEPTKYFNTVNPRVVLENISFDIDYCNETIEIHVNSKILNCSDWFKKLKSLQNWLIVDIKYNKNKMTIKI